MKKIGGYPENLKILTIPRFGPGGEKLCWSVKLTLCGGPFKINGTGTKEFREV